MRNRVLVLGILVVWPFAACGAHEAAPAGSMTSGVSGAVEPEPSGSGGVAGNGASTFGQTGASGATAGTGPMALGGSGGTPSSSGGTGGASGPNPNAAGSGASVAGSGSTVAGGSAGTAGGSGGGGSSGMSATSGASGTAGLPGTAGSPAGAAKFHVFLLLGQSNMAGYPKAQAADTVKDERIKVLGYDDCAATGRKTNAWAVAVPPLHECWNGAIGPGDWFARTLIEKLPAGDTIGLVPCAISGEKIETFLKAGGSKYAWIVQRAKLAQQAGGVIEGILFHQGESNNGDASWPGKVNQLVTDLKKDLGLGNVPFLAGELAYDGGCAGHNKLVNMLPAVVENAYVVSASGLALDPADTQWRLHFGHDAQVMFGKRYATAMIDALHW